MHGNPSAFETALKSTRCANYPIGYSLARARPPCNNQLGAPPAGRASTGEFVPSAMGNGQWAIGDGPLGPPPDFGGIHNGLQPSGPPLWALHPTQSRSPPRHAAPLRAVPRPHHHPPPRSLPNRPFSPAGMLAVRYRRGDAPLRPARTPAISVIARSGRSSLLPVQVVREWAGADRSEPERARTRPTRMAVADGTDSLHGPAMVVLTPNPLPETMSARDRRKWGQNQ
jgi:hypothetical protein